MSKEDHGGLMKKMDDGKQEVQVLHRWLWAINPFGNREVVLAAYCQGCDTVFTKLLSVDYPRGNPRISKLGLPKWGCVNPMEGL